MNKKGFTLIELLAVIILVPVVFLMIGVFIGNVIDNNRKEEYKKQIIKILKAGENYIANNVSAPSLSELFSCDGTRCTDGNISLEFTGEIPKSGSITMHDYKTLNSNYLSNGKYCAYGTKDNLKIAKNCRDIDISAPRVSGDLEDEILRLTLIDNESGIAGYCVTTMNDSSTCEWINTANTYIEYDLKIPGLYYVFAKDQKGNVSDAIEVGNSITPTYKES